MEICRMSVTMNIMKWLKSLSVTSSEKAYFIPLPNETPKIELEFFKLEKHAINTGRFHAIAETNIEKVT
jgi:hypothetical protein